MRFLSPTAHGYIDYLFVASLALAPTLLNFVSTAMVFCYTVAGAVLLLSLLTRYPLGVVKKIPFTVHGGIELVASLAVLASPWLFWFAEIDPARNFFLTSGILLFGVWLITDYKGVRTSTVGMEESPVREKAETLR